MTIKKILIIILILILQLLLIAVVINVVHEHTSKNYYEIGKTSGRIDGKYEALNQIIKVVGDPPKCTREQYNEEKVLMRVKGEEIFFAEKHGNFVSFCRG